jgi:hypothetical protein
MLGFKNFDCAATTIAGIELLRRIRKGQFAFDVSVSRRKLSSAYPWKDLYTYAFQALRC